jgi:ABC-type nickel/cobalt efflux system permease component RcnA
VSRARFTFAWSGVSGQLPVAKTTDNTARRSLVGELTTDKSVPQSRGDRLTELITTETLSPNVILLSLLVAFLLGSFHALTPGHGKTVVAAYLVGSRGTARHAFFLGTVVTLTHTVGVFALGLVALFASEYILPEQLYPWLGFASGLTIVAIGVSLFVKRLRSRSVVSGPLSVAKTTDDGRRTTDFRHHNGSDHDHSHHGHSHHHDGPDHDHSHHGHSHRIERITWGNLLALGVSGGIVPCPSALVVLLSAITLHRIGFGLILIVAFSLGLASVLIAIGLLMLYARRFMDRFSFEGGIVKRLPIFSAAIISVLGLVIAVKSLVDGRLVSLNLDFGEIHLLPALWGALALGFVLGLKHALDADHVAAVSTIVSEHQSLSKSSLVGTFWGIGHTGSLLLVGLAVIVFRLTIPESIALSLEFVVAVMLVVLGANILRKSFGLQLHKHTHSHKASAEKGSAADCRLQISDCGLKSDANPQSNARRSLFGGRNPQSDHAHLHLHLSGAHHHERHQMLKIARRPLLVGMVHGLAGSAALVLLVLTTIPSVVGGLLYILAFGLGSIAGMLVMSSLISVPFVFSARSSFRLNHGVRVAAGLFSVVFGLFLAWRIGVVERLFF